MPDWPDRHSTAWSTVCTSSSASRYRYIPFVLAGELGIRGRIITWRPRKETVESLREQPPTLLAEGDRGILARLRLKGNVIWREDEPGNPELYLDGEAYSFRERESQTTDLRLPSGDGDFEMWFWLFGERTEPTGIGIISNMESVVLSRPEVRKGISMALNRDRLREALPEAYEVATGQPFDFARASELIGRQELPDRVIIASSVPNLERLTALIGHALTELDLGIEYGQRTVVDVVENARQKVESGHRLDMVFGDEGLAAALVAEIPGTFDGPFIRF